MWTNECVDMQAPECLMQPAALLALPQVSNQASHTPVDIILQAGLAECAGRSLARVHELRQRRMAQARPSCS